MAESRGLACFGGGSGTLQKQSDRGKKDVDAVSNTELFGVF